MNNILLSSLNGGITSSAGDTLMIVFLVLFTIAVTLAGVYVIATNVNRQDNKSGLGAVLAKPESNFKVSHAVFLIVAMGFLIRIAFTLFTNGFLGVTPQNLASSDNTGGLIQYYSVINGLFTGQPPSSMSYGIYPIPFLFLTIFGGIATLFNGGPINLANPGLATQSLFRMPFIIFDMATAVLLFFAAKKFSNEKVGLGLVIIYSLSPIFIFASAIWGSMFSILAFFIVLTLYFMANKNFLGLTIAFSLALLTSRDAMLFAPVFLVFVLYHFVRVVRIIRAEKTKSNDLKSVRGRKVVKSEEETEADVPSSNKRALIFERDKGLAVRIPLYFLASLIGMYVLSLPFLGPNGVFITVSAVNFNPFSWFAALFVHPFGRDMIYVTYNGMSIYNLFGRNTNRLGENVAPGVYSILFFIVAIALVLTFYASKKNRANLVLIACYLVFTLSLFYMSFSELNLIVVLAGLLFSFILIKDKRILHVFAMLSITVLINASIVMMSAGYFGNIPLGDYGYPATARISEAGGAATAAIVMNLIMTAMTLLIFVYKSYIMLDIALANTRKPFATNQKAVLPVLKDFMRIRKK